MKPNFNFNKLIFSGALLAIIVFSATSCIKDYRNGETQFTGLKPSVLIPEGGLSSNTFNGAALTFPTADAADTAYFYVNYAATGVAPTDETITLGVDQNALTAYNSTSAVQFDLMPDSLFSFTSTQVTIKAGNNYSDPIPIIIYPNKIDPTKSYMVPISITAAPNGAVISGNQGTIYYHVIGNPIAGTYEELWTRWNSLDGSPPDTTLPPAYDQLDVGPVAFNPQSPTEIQVQSQGTGETDVIDFTNDNGTLTNFTASFIAAQFDPTNPAWLGITLTSGPVLEVADPVNGYYRIKFGYLNGSGFARTIVNEYYKQ